MSPLRKSAVAPRVPPVLSALPESQTVILSILMFWRALTCSATSSGSFSMSRSVGATWGLPAHASMSCR